MRSSNIGGQAVLEGVMMKNADQVAVAVRKPDGEITVKTERYEGIIKNKSLTRIPFVRGVFNFIDSMVLGMKTLTYSTSFYEEEEEKAEETSVDKEKQEKIMTGLTVTFSIVMAVAIFMVLPYFLTSFLGRRVSSRGVLALIEGAVRLGIFILYILLISRMKEIKRLFMYHGAEHKCINCIEQGRELNVANVRQSSKQHKRCGTSFMLFVMLVSIVVFFFIRVDSPILRVVLRILLIPVISGISYEIIRLAGRSDHWLIGLISKPGLMLQNLTTKEPDDEMIEVAIQAVEGVFDWKTFIAEE